MWHVVLKSVLVQTICLHKTLLQQKWRKLRGMQLLENVEGGGEGRVQRKGDKTFGLVNSQSIISARIFKKIIASTLYTFSLHFYQ